jgi:hypothetical protein
VPNFEVETGKRRTTLPLAIKASSWSATLTTISGAKPPARQFVAAFSPKKNPSAIPMTKELLGELTR